jgi:hypothetical protein
MEQDKKARQLLDNARRGQLQAVMDLLDGPDPPPIDYKDQLGSTALTMAAERGQEAVVVALLDRGADIHAQDLDGNTALLLASERGHQRLVQMLIARGASTSAQDNDGNTSLMLAAREGFLGIVQTLLAAGAQVSVQNRHGKTAEALAATKPIQTLLKVSELHHINQSDEAMATVHSWWSPVVQSAALPSTPESSFIPVRPPSLPPTPPQRASPGSTPSPTPFISPSGGSSPSAVPTPLLQVISLDLTVLIAPHPHLRTKGLRIISTWGREWVEG